MDAAREKPPGPGTDERLEKGFPFCGKRWEMGNDPRWEDGREREREGARDQRSVPGVKGGHEKGIDLLGQGK